MPTAARMTIVLVLLDGGTTVTVVDVVDGGITVETGATVGA